MGTRVEILGRLELGLKRYNHGVRVDDDTRMWGTAVYQLGVAVLCMYLNFTSKYVAVQHLEEIP